MSEVFVAGFLQCRPSETPRQHLYLEPSAQGPRANDREDQGRTEVADVWHLTLSCLLQRMHGLTRVTFR